MLRGCAAGFGDCDGEDGLCETRLSTATDCGACGVACAEGERCADGACVASDG